MSYAPLIKEILVNGMLAGSAVRKVKKTSAGLAVYATAGCVFFLGFVYLTIAAYNLLLETYNPATAAGLCGLGIIVFAGLIAGYGHYQKTKSVKMKPLVDGGLVGSVEHAMKSFMDNLEEPVRDNPKSALLMALLAGFAAGEKIN